MSNENNTAVADDEAGEQQTEERRSYAGYGLLAVAVIVLVIGTSQVLSANAEREAQLQKVKHAQSQMD